MKTVVACVVVVAAAGAAVPLGITATDVAQPTAVRTRSASPMTTAFSTATHPAPIVPRFNSSDELVSGQDLALAGTGGHDPDGGFPDDSAVGITDGNGGVLIYAPACAGQRILPSATGNGTETLHQDSDTAFDELLGRHECHAGMPSWPAMPRIPPAPAQTGP